MTAPDDGAPRRVPARALFFLSAPWPYLRAPHSSSPPPDILGEQGVLLWLLALVPAFLLAYYRGWRGAAVALAGGMATLSITHVITLLIGLNVPDGLFAVVIAHVAVMRTLTTPGPTLRL